MLLDRSQHRLRRRPRGDYPGISEVPTENHDFPLRIRGVVVAVGRNPLDALACTSIFQKRPEQRLSQLGISLAPPSTRH